MTTNLDALADAFLEAQINLDGAKERLEDAKATFIEALEAEGKFNPRTKAYGSARLRITPNRYFDVESATSEVSEEVLEECRVTKVDPKLLALNLTPKQKEQFMKDYAVPFKISVAVLGEDD